VNVCVCVCGVVCLCVSECVWCARARLSACDVETSKMARPRTEMGCSATQKGLQRNQKEKIPCALHESMREIRNIAPRTLNHDTKYEGQ
jgi:hypothetical protein